ncbi:MAG TPA: hypothetical protein VM658_17675 [bacterium]|nr:hypothetical protein [bacterium]
MPLTRRAFIRGTAALAAVVGPWSIAGRKGHAATTSSPALKFLTPSEYAYINNMAKEVVPDGPVLDGTVDVAKNLDWFFAERNTSPDFLIMMRYLRLIRLADPVLPLLNRLAPATGEDIKSFKKTICFLGYYSDANGEADMPPERRVVWPRLGYGGPKPDDWWPPDAEVRLDPSLLTDRIKEEGA